MEYIVKDQIERYSSQRDSIVLELISLNENLPFYDKKVLNLNLQIERIDHRIMDLVTAVERIKCMEITEKYKK